MSEVRLRIVESPEACARLRTSDMRIALATRPDLVFVGNTGRTPIDMYREWGKTGLDISRVHLRMLDSYVVSPSRGYEGSDYAGSFTRFVVERILGVLDPKKRPRDWTIPPENAATCEELAQELEEYPKAWTRSPHPITGEPGSEFVISPDAIGALARVRRACAAYEALLAREEIEIVSLGVGPLPYPHMAFNTGPYTRPDAPTHLTLLDPASREANAGEFGGDAENVPPFALTMGPATLLRGKELWITAIGSGKEAAIAHALADPRKTDFEFRSSIAYALRGARVDIVLDEDASRELLAEDGLSGLEARYREAGHALTASRE